MTIHPNNLRVSPKIRTLLNDVAELLRTDKLAMTLSIKYVKSKNPDLAAMIENTIEQTEGKWRRILEELDE